MGILRTTASRVVAACAVTAASVIAVSSVAVPAASADPFTYTQVSAGYHAACAVTSDGQGLCWGWNYQRSLGTLDTSDKVLTPSRIVLPGGRRFASISAGEYFTTCGLDTTGTVWCWGQHHTGSYFNPTSTVPVRVELPDGVRAASISNGPDIACAIDTDGGLWCWGDVASFGNGSTEATRTPERVPMPDNAAVTSVDAGPSGTTCTVTSLAHLYCWGNNDDGEAGVGYVSLRVARPTAVLLPDDQIPATVTAGLNRTCALTTDGTGWCWGDNYEGSFGDGTYTDSSRPQRMLSPASEAITVLQTAWYHTCAITVSGNTWCWGRGGFGELGTGTTLGGKTFRQPVLPAGTRLTSVSAGLATTCAIDTASHIWCWTGSTWGVAGVGNETMSLFPRQIAPIGTPTVLTPVASGVRAETARVSAVVTPNGSRTSSVFQVSGDETFTSPLVFPVASDLAATYGASTVTAALSGLAPRTTYWVRTVSTNEYGTTSGAAASFLTLGSEPVVSTPDVVSVGGTRAMLTVTIDPGMLSTASEAQWSTTSDFAEYVSVPVDALSGDSTAKLTFTLGDLAPRTNHWVRVVSTNRLGTTVSGAASFTTIGRAPAVLSTSAVSTVSSITVTARFDGGDLAGAAVAELSRDGSFGDVVESMPSRWQEGENVWATFVFTGLPSRTTYSVRVVARNAVGSGEGHVVSIRTKGGLPVVAAPYVSGVDTDTATVSATVDSTGLPTSVILQVSSDPNFSSGTDEHFLGLLSTDGPVTRSVALTGLDRRTTYWVRVTARNAAGTVTSTVTQFTTLSPTGVIINNDDDSTEDSSVTLSFTPPAGAVAVRVSDNPGMRNSRVLLSFDDTPWDLEPSEEASVTRTVYVQFVTASGALSRVYSDSIELVAPADSGGEDTVAPEVSEARIRQVTAAALRAKGPRLAVSGRDAYSGITAVQVRVNNTVTRHAFAATRRLNSTFTVPARGAVWVRLVDAAGNVSKWRKVRAK